MAMVMVMVQHLILKINNIQASLQQLNLYEIVHVQVVSNR